MQYFFSLVSREKKAKWLISDFNSDLVLSYTIIRDNVKELISSLETHAENYSKDSKCLLLQGKRNQIQKAQLIKFQD